MCRRYLDAHARKGDRGRIRSAILNGLCSYFFCKLSMTPLDILLIRMENKLILIGEVAS